MSNEYASKVPLCSMRSLLKPWRADMYVTEGRVRTLVYADDPVNSGSLQSDRGRTTSLTSQADVNTRWRAYSDNILATTHCDKISSLSIPRQEKNNTQNATALVSFPV